MTSWHSTRLLRTSRLPRKQKARRRGAIATQLAEVVHGIEDTSTSADDGTRLHETQPDERSLLSCRRSTSSNGVVWYWMPGELSTQGTADIAHATVAAGKALNFLCSWNVLVVKRIMQLR